MIRSFGNAATEDIFHGRDSRDARRVPQVIWPVIQRKLDMLNAAIVLGDLRSPPGNRLEALKGERAGTYSIRVNDQFRLTFRFEGGDAFGVVADFGQSAAPEVATEPNSLTRAASPGAWASTIRAAVSSHWR